MYLFIYFYLLMSFFEEVHGFCPSQCTCIYHGRSDGTGTRYIYFIICYTRQFIRKRIEEIENNILIHCKLVLA